MDMAKRFKGKRRLKFVYRLGIFLTCVLASFWVIFSFLYNKFLKTIDNDTLINYLVSYNLNTKNQNPFLLDVLNLDSTDFLLKYTLGITPNNNDSVPVVKEENEYVEDPIKTTFDKPLVYIYNTHQSEEYRLNNDNAYNVTPTVLMASYILRENLADLGIPALVETKNMSEVLKLNNLNYNSSYKASMMLINDAKANYPSINYFIDLHRDSINYDLGTTTVNGKKYAKVMLVMGGNYDNTENLKMANAVNAYLKSIDDSLSRGVFIRNGSVYNQDVSPNAILVEIGGPFNYINEVNNTVKLLSEAIYKYIKGEI